MADLSLKYNDLEITGSRPKKIELILISTLAISGRGSELIQQDLPILGVKLVGFEWIR